MKNKTDKRGDNDKDSTINLWGKYILTTEHFYSYL